MRPTRLIALVVVAVSMIASLATAERRIAKLRADATLVERVDMGVTLIVVRKEQQTGHELIRGLPRMVQVGEPMHFGGMVQVGGVPKGWTEEMGPPPSAFYVGPSRNPVVWHASEQQARLIVHDDDLPQWLLIEGSEGSGKTRALAMWLAIQALRYVGTDAEHGATAPTGDRLGHMRDAIAKTWPASWYRYSKQEDLYTWHAGPRFQLVTAAERSAEAGSAIQGYTWVGAVSDELQDHFATDANIQARLRDPRAGGRARRLCSSTQKDSPEWRTFREVCRNGSAKDGAPPIWGVRKLLGLDSPFIFDAHWHALRASGTMTDREWRRRILALDVGPEKQVYFNWLRTFESGKPANLRALPAGAVDVTAEVLRPWGDNVSVLVGHDPGRRQHVSMFLKAFRFRDQRDKLPRWFVVDEVTSNESTVEAHARSVLARLRGEWGCHGLDTRGRPDPDSPIALVRIDPHTRGGDEHPGDDVYTIWRRIGMVAKAAAYAHGSTRPAVIKKSSRIDMINTLLAATSDVGEMRRLFVLVGDDGRPAAPRFVEALETMETDHAGRAETEAKDANDLSHWPAAVGYALWQVESPRVRMRQEAA